MREPQDQKNPVLDLEPRLLSDKKAMLAFREKARPKMNIEVKDKKDFVNIAKKFNIAERHVTKIQDQKLLNMVINQKLFQGFTGL